jgi:flagellar motor switch protein FliG
VTIATVGLSGLRKAAILLVQLGREKASKVMSRLPEDMVEELTAEIVRLKEVSSADAAAVLSEAHNTLVNWAASAPTP